MRCFCNRERDKVVVCAGRKDSVEPGLFVNVARSCESCSRELFGIKTQWRLLRRIPEDRESTCNLISRDQMVMYLLLLQFRDSCQSHSVISPAIWAKIGT